MSLSPDATRHVGDAEKTATVLAGYIDRFLAAWDRAGPPPDLHRFLPDEGPQRREVLIELVKVDLEHRWQGQAEPKHLTDYLREFPELAADGVPVDLVYEEFHIRRQCGLAVDPREYLQQFPNQADELARLLGVTNEFDSTSVPHHPRKENLQTVMAGQQVDDFDLLAQLGEGAFARVFLARQRSMQRLVALKVSADSGTEPQVLAQFDHDYIVRVYDQRVLPDRQLRLLYMQYLSGGSLHDVLQLRRERGEAAISGRLLLDAVAAALEARGESRPAASSLSERLGSLSWAETVCWIGACLARGLDHAHRRGVLHRDVKPANVLLTAEGIPKLADFNISCSTAIEKASPAAYFGGSVAYMSPEQLEACNPAESRQADSLDGRADLYSLGVLMWELLTGSRPFPEKPQPGGWAMTLAAMTFQRHKGLSEQIERQLPADSPPGLIHVLRKCLAADREARWASGAELARQLDFCQKRRVQELLYPHPSRWTSRLEPYFVVAVVLLTAIPNILAGIFNYHYNKAEIVEHLGSALGVFWRLQMCVNAVAYPLGLGFVALVAWSIARGRFGFPERHFGVVHPAATRRERCLALGHGAAVVGVGLWALAGVVYPLCMHLLAGAMPMQAYVHFFSSLLLCGLVAGAYPFFLITCLGLRTVYPRLVREEQTPGNDAAALAELRRRARKYLMSAVSVPLLAVLLLSGFHVRSEMALIVLSAGSLVGFALVFRCFQRLEADAAVLQDVFSTSEEPTAR